MADTENVTPSMKKLKQARLPFQILSSPDEPVQPRKLKLLSRENGSIEKAVKLSKPLETDEPAISKENNLNSSADLVVISDDDSNSIDEHESRETIKNPLVNLVDKVLKKRARKNNVVKKRKSKRLEGDDVIVLEEKQEISTNSDGTIENKTINSSFENTHGVSCDNTTGSGQRDRTNNTKIVSGCETEAPSMRCSLTVDKKSIDQSDSNQTANLTPKVPLLENDISEVKKISLPPDPKEIASENISKASNLEDNLSDVEMSSPSDHNRTPLGNISTSSIVTPKNDQKSLRMSTTQESNNSKLDDSAGECTPKKGRKESKDIASSPNLTPKQLQKKIESAKKREEREKEKLERERKRQQEKEEKAKLRQEKEDQRQKEREEKEELKRKEREDREEQKRKEKEEREKQKELEKREKEERDEQKKREKEEKEEQKRKEKEAKEEERRKKQEALEEDKRQKELEKVEQELKKKKAAEAFANFFVPKQKKQKDVTFESENKSSTLSTFMIKSDMRLAPLVRNSLTDEQKIKLDSFVVEKLSSDTLYLKQLQNKDIIPMVSVKTWQSNEKDDDDDDCTIVESGDELPPCETAGEAIIFSMVSREKLKPKLLSFHENTRPPYWGTWRKKSKHITPRRPFATDASQLEYDVDSEEEWEEEGEGESVGGSVADDEEGDADDYEVDNEFFVPHGYLSDEEATKDEDDVMSLSPETQKAKLKHLEEEFEFEMKKPTEKLKPRLYGLLWENSDGGKPDNCIDALWNYFRKFTMIMDDPTPLLQPPTEQEDAERKVKKRKISDGGENGQKREKKKARSEKDIKRTKSVELKKPEAKNQSIINAFLVKSKDST